MHWITPTKNLLEIIGYKFGDPIKCRVKCISDGKWYPREKLFDIYHTSKGNTYYFTGDNVFKECQIQGVG